MAEKKKNFEEAMSELENIVESLENGELTLDESIEIFQRGMALSKYCSKRLDEIEKKITVVIENEKGQLIEENFDPENL